METLYTAQRVADTENGWLITNNETKKEVFVFCRLDANTAEDAVSVLEASLERTETQDNV